MPARRGELVGVALVLASAASFSSATILAKLAFDERVTAETLIGVRLAGGALFLWILAGASRQARRFPPGRATSLLAMGIISAAVAVLFFQSLARIEASATTLLFYAHPAMVAGAAFVLGRERLGLIKLGTLVLGLAGVALVVGAPRGGMDALGLAMALGAAVGAAGYVVVAQRAIVGVHPLAAGALVLTGATVAFVPPAAAAGTLDLGVSGEGWRFLALVGATSAAGFALFLGALRRLGPTRTAIGASFEPVVTVALAAVVLDETLSPLQLVGGAMVVAALAILPLSRERLPRAEQAPPVAASEATAVATER